MCAQQDAKVFEKALTTVALVTLGTVETLALSLLAVVTSPLYLSSYTRPLFQAFKDLLVMTLTSLTNTANDLYTSQKTKPAKVDPKKETPAPFNYKKAALLAVGALAIVGSVYLVAKHQEVIQKWAASIKNPFFNEPPPPPSLMEQVTQKATDTAITLKDYSIKAIDTLGKTVGPISAALSTAGAALGDGIGYVWDKSTPVISTLFQAVWKFELACAKTTLEWDFFLLKGALSLTGNLLYYGGYSVIHLIKGIGGANTMGYTVLCFALLCLITPYQLDTTEPHQLDATE